MLSLIPGPVTASQEFGYNQSINKGTYGTNVIQRHIVKFLKIKSLSKILWIESVDDDVLFRDLNRKYLYAKV